ncbi:SAVMC3_10250 family protein [Kutzneria kofuensis]|uniref:Uncharacterized protein n=1 Tax=Kutzneria kofuensis TaxID=103725 RepID=A0A7W9KRN7_9PSEU|nr:SAVMC3_10250 family protein [Kutzneria kofuensis]MBB5896749.1 hypothetical protein [Kutzneria kofuensis]
MYHEFVYVSGEKVRNCVPMRTAWWQGLRVRKLGAGLKFSPVEASLDVEPTAIAEDDRRLGKLMEYLDGSGRYYTEPDVDRGEWVMFEGHIGMALVDTEPAPGAVLFCEAEPLAVTTPRIVLHGSAQHLRASVSPTTGGAPPERRGGYSVATHANVARILDAASKAHRAAPPGGLRRLFGGSAEDSTDLEQNLATYFREVACTAEYRDFAPYLGGHARITAVLRPPSLPFPVIMASPLYVRYERP